VLHDGIDVEGVSEIVAPDGFFPTALHIDVNHEAAAVLSLFFVDSVVRVQLDSLDAKTQFDRCQAFGLHLASLYAPGA
jgi:hypothetical protein